MFGAKLERILGGKRRAYGMEKMMPNVKYRKIQDLFFEEIYKLIEP